MSRVIALAACGFTLAACTSTPTWEWPGADWWRPAPPTAQLRIESQPPGADARTSQGQTCRTPCEVTVQATGEFTVSYALNGYDPQTIPVRAQDTAAVPDSGSNVRLDPNPVFAELQPTPPPKRRPRRKKRKSRVSAAPPPPTPAAMQPAAAQASQPTQPALAPAAAYPWPPPPAR